MECDETRWNVSDLVAGAEPFFRHDVPLEVGLPHLAAALRAFAPLDAVVLVRFGAADFPDERACWSASPLLPPALLGEVFAAHEDGAVASRLLQEAAGAPEGLLRGEELCALLPAALSAASLPLFLPMRQGGDVLGFALFNKESGSGDWTAEERGLIAAVGALAGLLFFGKRHCARQAFHNGVLNAAMDQVKVCLYITNPETDEILYMNRSMKDVFRLEHPEGGTCWKVLQTGKSGRCDFCPVKGLLAQGDTQTVYRWEERNSRTGRIFENYDSLMRWTDGSLVHLQQSIDVTDSKRLSKEASVDELTGLLNRRAGLAALAGALEDAGNADAPLSVALADVNFLKSINDGFGHPEGDRVLRLVAQELQDGLEPPDFCFRLSGDEFIVVFRADRHTAILRMEEKLRCLKRRGRELGAPYAPEFCFGSFEVSPGHGLTPIQVLAKADENMYEQKKLFHIRAAVRKLADAPPDAPAGAFTYDSTRLYDALDRSTDAYIYVSNMKTGTFRYSPAMVEEFGLPGEIVENAAAVWGDRVHPDDKSAFLEANQLIADGRTNSHCVEYRVRNRLGEWVWVRCRGFLERSAAGEPVLFAGFITNLGQENKIDHITGLMNKIKLAEDVTASLERHPTAPLCLMVLGADGFKQINELYNRRFGDEVLRVITRKMLEILPSYATPYRLDGDEFGVLIHGDAREADLVYRSLFESFRFQQEYDGKKYFCTLSAGCAGYPKDAGAYAELLQYAGSALEVSKKNGKNRMTFFSPDLISGQKRRLELIELLRESIERRYEGFEVVYQPQMTADGGRLAGAEALARWTSRKYGRVSPVEFIPLLEQSGLIVPFGKWMLREAAAQARAWLALRPDFVVSVNLSYLQVASDDMVPFIAGVLEKLGLNPANLVVEFTESCMIRENDQISRIFSEIRNLGVRIAMDDFGTGYSSLGMLKTSPADVVKIDRTFVRDILNSKFDATFIRFIVELCHDVGIKVCLEGVEREEELAFVRPMGLDYIQGYLFGRPMGADEFRRVFLEPAASQGGGTRP